MQSSTSLLLRRRPESLRHCARLEKRGNQYKSSHHPMTLSSLPGGWYDQPTPRFRKAIKAGRVIISYGRATHDDETTATQIHSFLVHNGVDVSLTTILSGRHTLGWTFHGSAYCQLIREADKQKRLEWAQLHLHDNFHDVVWTNETTIQLQSHKRYCCSKASEPPHLKDLNTQ